MAGKKPTSSSENDRPLIQFSVAGLTGFVIAVIASTTLLLYGLYLVTARVAGARAAGGGGASLFSNVSVASAAARDNPWGELMVQEIQLERPQEYIAFESKTNRQATWKFAGMNPTQVSGILQNCGLTDGQIAKALAPARATWSAAQTILRPDDELILSLPPEARSCLYSSLAQLPDNPAHSIPLVCTKSVVSDIIAETAMDAAEESTFKKLIYTSNGKECFCDQELMLRHLPTLEQRNRFMQFLLRQNALLIRLKIKPDSDIEKLLGYWAAPARGVRFTDTRPLLESLKRNPDGGSASILYLLPPFARQRLNTFPFVTGDDVNKPNCHWSTFNFFNAVPDDRFYDLGYLNKYLMDNFYTIATPSSYGDIILLLDKNNYPIHSAVHVCDDIVFTKNGASYEQPWALMHLKDVLNIYAATPNLHTSVWRNKQM